MRRSAPLMPHACLVSNVIHAFTPHYNIMSCTDTTSDP